MNHSLNVSNTSSNEDGSRVYQNRDFLPPAATPPAEKPPPVPPAGSQQVLAGNSNFRFGGQDDEEEDDSQEREILAGLEAEEREHKKYMQAVQSMRSKFEFDQISFHDSFENYGELQSFMRMRSLGNFNATSKLASKCSCVIS